MPGLSEYRLHEHVHWRRAELHGPGKLLYILHARRCRESGMSGHVWRVLSAAAVTTDRHMSGDVQLPERRDLR